MNESAIFGMAKDEARPDGSSHSHTPASFPTDHVLNSVPPLLWSSEGGPQLISQTPEETGGNDQLDERQHGDPDPDGGCPVETSSG